MEILVPMKNSLRIGALIGGFALLSGALSVPAYAQAVVSLQASPKSGYTFKKLDRKCREINHCTRYHNHDRAGNRNSEFREEVRQRKWQLIWMVS